MAEYYKAKDVLHIIDLVMSDEGIKHTGKAIRKRLKALPTEDVEKVVRCKDCVFWSIKSNGLSDEHICRRFSCSGVCDNYTTPDDYCSYGERRYDV